MEQSPRVGELRSRGMNHWSGMIPQPYKDSPTIKRGHYLDTPARARVNDLNDPHRLQTSPNTSLRLELNHISWFYWACLAMGFFCTSIHRKHLPFQDGKTMIKQWIAVRLNFWIQARSLDIPGMVPEIFLDTSERLTILMLGWWKPRDFLQIFQWKTPSFFIPFPGPVVNLEQCSKPSASSFPWRIYTASISFWIPSPWMMTISNAQRYVHVHPSS